MKNHSPWLHQLNSERPISHLEGKKIADVAIIGGGIAGIATAYYTLKNTNKTVILVEGYKIAHGATGHNGGFLATYFERTFSSLVQEFGLEMAAEAQQAMESTWALLEEIRTEAKLKTPVWQFTGYAACATLEEIVVHLRDNALRAKAGLANALVMVSKEAECVKDIPEVYKDLYTIVPKADILSLLETDDESYIAILPERKGCMNSALFCEELLVYLLATCAERFAVVEHAPVKRLVLKDKHAVLHIEGDRMVVTSEVVLCTNGFEKINIINTIGPSINKRFHHLVRGIVGYMAGYIEELKKPPAEISYLPKNGHHTRDIYSEEPYFYLTRRPFEMEKHETHNLICVGGPEALMDDTNNYKLEHPFSEEAKRQIDNFLKFTYKHGPKDEVKYKFLWHGLMGFTPNGVRLIGPEPANALLYYNLGCNGVGLLPSIYGGQRISWFLSGMKLKPSIFDPGQGVKIQKNKRIKETKIK